MRHENKRRDKSFTEADSDEEHAGPSVLQQALKTPQEGRVKGRGYKRGVVTKRGVAIKEVTEVFCCMLCSSAHD